jgi:hypothetical protein
LSGSTTEKVDVPLPVSYVLPLKWVEAGPLDELTAYLRMLANRVEVIVVDGSPAERFCEHHRRWGGFVRHLVPDVRIRFLNGKVNGVLTGVDAASHDAVVIADDDVRYGWDDLQQTVAGLEQADVVRPQNYYDPLPWHARWDTARILLNRVLGGDFPGTLGVRRSTLVATGGYDGDVLFENLELMRTVEAAGGVVLAAPWCFVRRLPPTPAHFLDQRVRQAYDEWARPVRMAVSLAVAPVVIWTIVRRRFSSLAVGAVATVVTAEVGRRRAGGAARFPASSSLLAPGWVLERAVCSWVACLHRARGGCPYAGARLLSAATPVRRLRARHSDHARSRKCS